jgi:hypothetical protein
MRDEKKRQLLMKGGMAPDDVEKLRFPTPHDIALGSFGGCQ